MICDIEVVFLLLLVVVWFDIDLFFVELLFVLVYDVGFCVVVCGFVIEGNMVIVIE